MRLYDGGKIIAGLVIFIGLLTFPIWWNHGGEKSIPNPEKPKNGATECVKDVEYMRTTHMKLLNDWRDEVVRDGERKDLVIQGVTYEKSLQNGCMKCHASKKKFCDECHDFTAVKPYCWDCHIQPEETT